MRHQQRRLGQGCTQHSRVTDWSQYRVHTVGTVALTPGTPGCHIGYTTAPGVNLAEAYYFPRNLAFLAISASRRALFSAVNSSSNAVCTLLVPGHGKTLAVINCCFDVLQNNVVKIVPTLIGGSLKRTHSWRLPRSSTWTLRWGLYKLMNSGDPELESAPLFQPLNHALNLKCDILVCFEICFFHNSACSATSRRRRPPTRRRPARPRARRRALLP
jgi:hypothetical protein